MKRIHKLRLAALGPLALVILSVIVLLIIGKVQGSNAGRVDIPTVLTEAWKAFVAACLVSSLGAWTVLIIRQRERNALLTMLASDAARVAERSVLYRRQQRKELGVSKSEIEVAVKWETVTRLFDLVENDTLKKNVFTFYERLNRAAPHFARANGAASGMEVLRYDIEFRKKAIEAEHGKFLDPQGHRRYDDELEGLEGRARAADIEAQAARASGLAFFGKPCDEDKIESLAESIVEECRKELKRTGEWHPCQRMNATMKDLAELEEG